MSRYKSRYRWRKVEAGYYESPDGRYKARRQSDGRWHLTGETVRLRHECLSLSDCQEIAANMEATRQVMAKLEGERP